MIRNLILAGLLMVPVSVAAFDPTPIKHKIMAPAMIRPEFIYQLARASCPKIDYIRETDMAEFIDGLKDQFNLSEPEVNSLLNHCLLYEQGRAIGR